MKNTQANSVSNQSRRRLIQTLSSVAAAGMIAVPIVANADGHGHKHHHGVQGDNAIVDAVAECIKTGNACIDHCIMRLADKDTSLAGCLETTRAMVPVLEATLVLASSQSKHLSKLIVAAVAVTKDCRAECKIHAEHHAECKACLAACEQFLSAADTFTRST